MTTIYRHLDFSLPGLAELADAPAVVPGYRDALLALGPVAYWPLDEASGSTLADLTAAHPLSLSGSYQLGAAEANRSAPGSAVRLIDGAAAAAGPVLPTPASAGFTLLAWVRRDDLGQEGEVFSQYLLGDPGRMVIRVLAGGGVRYRVQADAAVSTAALVLTEQWTHLAITRDGPTVTIYINGQPAASDSNQLTPLAPGPFALGKYALAADATLDEVVVFDSALSPARIAALARLARSHPDPAEDL